MSTHTPGPWQSLEPRRPLAAGEGYSIRTKPFRKTGDKWNGYIGHVLGDAPNAEANARLIAAAPDLLAACKALVEAGGNPTSLRLGSDELQRFVSAWGDMRAAIAKAEGAL